RLLFLSFLVTATATTELYTLSLHDALPICSESRLERTNAVLDIVHRLLLVHGRTRGYDHVPGTVRRHAERTCDAVLFVVGARLRDRKSTRLNSSHLGISYAVFCLKKKNKKT